MEYKIKSLKLYLKKHDFLVYTPFFAAIASVSLFRISVFYDEVSYESLLQYSIIYMCVVCFFK